MLIATRMEDVQPLGPIVENITQRFDHDEFLRLEFLAYALSNSLEPLSEDEVREYDRKLGDFNNHVYIRAYAQMAAGLWETVLNEVRKGATPQLVVSPVDGERAAKLSAAWQDWSREERLQAAVRQALAAAQEVVSWTNRSLVAVFLERACNRHFIPPNQDPPSFYPVGLSRREIGEQCDAIDTFCYGRAKSIYNGRFAPALRALQDVPVSKRAEDTKALFVLTDEQVRQLGLNLVHHREDTSAFEQTPEPEEVSEPEPDVRTTEGGIVYFESHF